MEIVNLVGYDFILYIVRDQYILNCIAYIIAKIYETERGSNKEGNINHIGQHAPLGNCGG